jgi:hypothetical protein
MQHCTAAEYRQRYDAECERALLIARGATTTVPSGVFSIVSGDPRTWATVLDGTLRPQDWEDYAKAHGPLVSMNADGSWHPFSPEDVRA